MILFNKKNISTETPVSVERESSLFIICLFVISFNIFPNPTTSEITIKYPISDDKVLSLKILDNKGELVFRKAIDNTGKYSFNTNDLKLTDGFYLVQLIGNATIYTCSFIKSEN